MTYLLYERNLTHRYLSQPRRTVSTSRAPLRRPNESLLGMPPRVRCVPLALAHPPADQVHRPGLTSRKMLPREDAQLPVEYNLGLTNLVARPTVEVCSYSTGSHCVVPETSPAKRPSSPGAVRRCPITPQQDSAVRSTHCPLRWARHRGHRPRCARGGACTLRSG